MQNTRTEFLKETLKKKIICFGAGKFLINVIGFLESENLKIEKLIDNSKRKWGTWEQGMLVEKPDILMECDKDEYVIFISTKNFADEIESQIKDSINPQFSVYRWPLKMQGETVFDEKLWYERIYKPCESMYREISKTKRNANTYLEEKQTLLNNREKIILPRTPLMITTRCTLCCSECSNLMPYYTAPKDYPADEIMEWIDNICNVVDEWTCCELVGGEPFLHRNLSEILLHALGKDKIQRVEFTTNGSIVPEPAILNVLKNDKVFIKISEYPGLIDWKKITQVFDQYNISYTVMENMRWTKTGNLSKRNRSQSDIKSQYLNCTQAKMCKTILNGKMYVCSKAASLMELGYVTDFEMIDLLNTEDLREQIKIFLQLTSSKACDYCDLASTEEEIVAPAEQIERK